MTRQNLSALAKERQFQLLGIAVTLGAIAIPSTIVCSQTVLSDLEPEEEEITVVGKILNQPVYAPFRREATVKDSTRPVYVINREQIEAQGARTVQEALKYLPGILSDGTAGGQLGALSSQLMRGGNSAQVLILIDGRPINDVSSFGGFDLSEFTTDNIERIEVLPGGGSTLYGSDALGGIINIITKSPSAQPEINVRSAVGSFGLNEQAIQLRGREEGLGWALGYSRVQSENNFPFKIERINLEDRRRNAQVLYNNFNIKLEGQLSDRDQIRFGAIYLTKTIGIPGGIAIPNSIGAFNTLTPKAEQFTNEVLLDLTWNAKLGDGDDSSLTSRIYTDFLSYNYNNPDLFGSKDDINRRTLGVQVQHDWKVASNQRVIYGVDYRHTRARNNTFSYSLGSTTTNYDGEIGQGGLFALYQGNLTPDFTINLGVRQDFNSLANSSATSPSVGARFNFSPETVLRANYARSFRAPQLTNLEGLAAFNIAGNRNLKPEIGDSFDIGIDQILGEVGLLRLTFFNNRIEDLIAFKFGAPSTYENIGRVKSSGLEAALNLQLARELFFFANYTLNDPRIDSDRNAALVGKELSFRGADNLNLGFAYETTTGFYASIILRQLSAYFVNNTNTESLPGYTTVDLKVRIPLGGNVGLNGSLDNVFDRNYEQYPGYPGVGRSFRLGFSATF